MQFPLTVPAYLFSTHTYSTAFSPFFFSASNLLFNISAVLEMKNVLNPSNANF